MPSNAAQPSLEECGVIVNAYILRDISAESHANDSLLVGSSAHPLEVSVDPSANVFISGGNAKVVQRVDAVTATWGAVAGIASQPGIGGYTGDGGLATQERLNSNGTSVDAQN